MRTHHLRAVLIATFAALFGLGTPLCAFACGAGATVAASAAPAEEPPCHGSAPTSPAEPAERESGCDCDGLRVIVTKSEARAATAAPLAISVPMAPPAYELHPQRSHARIWKKPPRLPPRDLLLLKSTLLL